MKLIFKFTLKLKLNIFSHPRFPPTNLFIAFSPTFSTYLLLSSVCTIVSAQSLLTFFSLYSCAITITSVGMFKNHTWVPTALTSQMSDTLRNAVHAEIPTNSTLSRVIAPIQHTRSLAHVDVNAKCI